MLKPFSEIKPTDLSEAEAQQKMYELVKRQMWLQAEINELDKKVVDILNEKISLLKTWKCLRFSEKK